MRIIRGYFGLIAALSMLLVILAPVIQLVVEIVFRIREGAWARFDLARVAPEFTAPLLDRTAGTTQGLLLNLFFDMWLCFPVMIALLVVWAVHGGIRAVLG